jgi:hypothetical protein
MAPQALLECFDWDNDAAEMVQAANNLDVVCSNHSYGYPRGWREHKSLRRFEWYGDPAVDPTEDYLYGKYAGDAFLYDRVVEIVPRLCVFVAAGNERGDVNPFESVPNFDGRHFVPVENRWRTEFRKSDGWDKPGYDTLEGAGLAKNVITVGAIEDIAKPDPKPADVKVASFSSLGPADDGRIKPDVVANGTGLYSPSVRYDAAGALRDDGYEWKDGTSMAAPAATGIGALLHQLAKSKLGRTLFADEMKALLVHTAMSPNQGPTYILGWGAIRADDAGDVLVGKGGFLRRLRFDGDFEWKGRRSGSGGIRVTLVWLDPPGPANTGGLDDPKPCLVHNLDLVVAGPDGTPHLPWRLDPKNPSRAAERGRNRIDNVERVDVPTGALAAGTWTVRITVPPKARGRHAALVVGGLDPDDHD